MGNTWAYNDRPTAVRFAPDDLDEDARERVEAQAWDFIVVGRDSADDFASYLDDEEEDIAAAAIVETFNRMLVYRRAQQAEWGEVQSNLDLAFAELTERGIVARQNFSCCGSCASVEIHDERDDSRAWLGWVWYDEQDTEALVESDDGTVYIGYGAYPGADFDEAAYEALPEEARVARYEHDVRTLMHESVLPVFARHGIEVQWDDDLSRRILLKNAQVYIPV